MVGILSAGKGMAGNPRKPNLLGLLSALLFSSPLCQWRREVESHLKSPDDDVKLAENKMIEIQEQLRLFI
jgi:hypothetical protein